MRTKTSSYAPAPAATAAVMAKAKPEAVPDHIIWSYTGDPTGPTLILIGGLHGNEPAGAVALKNVALELENLKHEVKGRVYFLRGNTRALEEGVRFIDADLNRHWTQGRLSSRTSGLIFPVSEDHELRELDNILDHILVTAMDEVYVVDLHSTSADGVPFATVGDTLRNRAFAQKFPATILLGIEEQLEGTLLEYLNDLGAVTLGFEGGQHRSDETVRNHEAIAWLALTNTGILDKTASPAISDARHHLAAKADPTILEVLHRHAVTDDDSFKMKPGFDNFDPVSNGDVLARDKNGRVRAEMSGVLLMPLYQRLGEDGYFIGRPVARFWLLLSAFLRKLGVQNLIHLLPGVRMDENSPATLHVDTRIARMFPLQIFHLLGFRKRRWRGDKLIVSRRKHDVISPFKQGATR